MRHQYTAQQLDHAMGASHDITGDDDILEVSFEGIRAFLNALPEPDQQDDWQKCGFNDFRPTDKRVKAVFIGGSIIEGTPDRRSSEHVFLVDGPVIHSYDDATFYRIPAPVVAPDPAEHPVIYVKDCDIVGFIPKIMVWYRDSYVAGRQCLSPEQITDWQQIDPAKVVADNA